MVTSLESTTKMGNLVKKCPEVKLFSWVFLLLCGGLNCLVTKETIFSEYQLKACVFSRFGSPEVVTVSEIETPRPKLGEVLIRVHATTVTTADWRIRSATFPHGFATMSRLVFGWSKPRKQVLGSEFSGEIVELGERVSNFKVGDAVIGFSAWLGAHAEYKVMKSNAAIVLKPKQMSFEEAAALPFGGTTALYFLKDIGKLKGGEKVLVIGAGGSVGTAAIQLAKHFGAHVTAVCSASKSANVLALGAERVIDYGLEDFSKGSEKYDVILDTIGSTTFSKCCDVLSEKGRLLMIAAGINEFLSMAWTGIKGGKKALGGVAPGRASDILKLIEIFELGAYRPMIDRVYPMDQIVNAHRLVDGGHKFGSVVVKII